MVHLNETELVITITHQAPADFLGGLQNGILEMVKTIIGNSHPNTDVAFDQETADGCVYALGLLQATLADPNAIQMVQELAGRVIPAYEPPQGD